MPETDPIANPAPASTPPAADPPAATPPPAPNAGANEENKFRRLFEAEEAKRKQTEQRLAELEAADKTRREAEMTELQKVQARAEEAEAKAKALESENLKRRIAAEKNLTPEALDFLHGDDEATLTANADRLAALVVRPPIQAGTNTNPGSQQRPSVDDQIAAAQKAGNYHEAIRLKREKAGIGRVVAQ